MAKDDITLRVTFSKRKLKGLLALGVAAGTAYVVRSETVKLSTVYPAPVATYKKLLTTQDTLLARDGGSVGVGTRTPAVKLDVVGAAAISGRLEAGGLSLRGKRGQDVADPGLPGDAANMRYVLNEIAKMKAYADGGSAPGGAESQPQQCTWSGGILSLPEAGGPQCGTQTCNSGEVKVRFVIGGGANTSGVVYSFLYSVRTQQSIPIRWNADTIYSLVGPGRLDATGKQWPNYIPPKQASRIQTTNSKNITLPPGVYNSIQVFLMKELGEDYVSGAVSTGVEPLSKPIKATEPTTLNLSYTLTGGGMYPRTVIACCGAEYTDLTLSEARVTYPCPQ